MSPYEESTHEATYEEDVLRDMLHRSTEDLFAPPAATISALGYCRRHRRRQLRRVVLSTATSSFLAVAALVAFALFPSSHDHATVTTPRPATETQKELYRLASESKKTPPPQGRYAVLTERQDGNDKISVIDRDTGDIWTYEQGPGLAFALPLAVHGSLTSAEFAALPTTPSALRPSLLKQASVQAQQAGLEKVAAISKLLRQRLIAYGAARPVVAGAQDYDATVFQEATDMLWNPLVGPQLRSALYQVLATTPGVEVDSSVVDALGRPAVEISRLDPLTDEVEATFESPETGAVLETAFAIKPGPNVTYMKQNGVDVYLSVSWTNSVPPNPFRA